MTAFVVGAIALLLACALLLLPGRRGGPRAADLGDPNLTWYRQRREELEGEASPALLEEARLRLLEDGVDDAAAGKPVAAARSPAPWLLPLIVILAGVLYWRLGAVEDVLIYRALEAVNPDDGAALTRLAARVAERSAERPDNLQYLGLLAQLQAAEEDFSASAASYARLAAARPDDARAQAQAAQSRFLATGRQLDEEARRYAERALALDPQQSTALGLLGMASFESGRYAAAVDYWRRLQQLEVEGSPGYQMLANVIAAAQQRAGAGAVPAADTAGDRPGIEVTLNLPPGAQVAPAATVYVFARDPNAASRMPIAVRRLTAGDLPATVVLSDADSMAGQRLSEVAGVVISAQLSRNGQPGEANAAYLGRSGTVNPGVGSSAVSIQLAPVDAIP